MPKIKARMPEQDPARRIKTFDEVNLGYAEQQAVEESSRCLQCKNPKCVDACPVKIDIPSFIKCLKEKKVDNALTIIKKSNCLPGVCGRVCPQEKQCESACILSAKDEPINIGGLERFSADNGNAEFEMQKKNGEKIAIVGSGPAGLSCAATLAQMGHNVWIFEALHKLGGVMVYGIPEFRLPAAVIEKEIAEIKKLGVEIKTNLVIGKTFTVDELLKEHSAVFVGSGAGLPHFLQIQGENLIGVFSANEFLTRVNLMKAHKKDYATPIKRAKKTVVIGGGNVAMDAARVAKRLGSDVSIVYRRSLEEMPAREEEIRHAKEEGIEFLMLTSPLRIFGKKKVEGIECIQMMLSAVGADGRRTPEQIEGSEFTIECDQIIIAIGQSPNSLLTKEAGIKTGGKGNIIIDERFKTSKSMVFAGGDIISGSSTIIKAISDGKNAAIFIDKLLKEESRQTVKED